MDLEYDRSIHGLDLKKTGKRIGQIIDERGMTNKELGEILGITVQSISKWRNGWTLPDVENLYLLSKVFRITMNDFLVPVNGDRESKENDGKEDGSRLVPSAVCRRHTDNVITEFSYIYWFDKWTA